MSSLREMQSIDRELFSELRESLINPAFLYMSTPSRSENIPLFYLQLNGEALWQLRQLIVDPKKVFDALQDSLPQIGYKLSSSSSVGVGGAVKSRIAYILQKTRNITSGKNRKAMRFGYWCSVALHPEEIAQGPQEVIDEQRLPEEEKEKVRSILYIMDKFSISLEGYHELCQVDKSLPRAHLVQTFAKEMDSQWDLKRTPGAAHGAELPFRLLMTFILCRCNMSHSCEYFNSEAMTRRVDSSWPKQPGCHSAPFSHIPIDHVILDELHLMLRITDRLEEGLILDVLMGLWPPLRIDGAN